MSSEKNKNKIMTYLGRMKLVWTKKIRLSFSEQNAINMEQKQKQKQCD